MYTCKYSRNINLLKNMSYEEIWHKSEELEELYEKEYNKLRELRKEIEKYINVNTEKYLQTNSRVQLKYLECYYINEDRQEIINALNNKKGGVL